MHETTRLLRDLVATPSINPMGRALTGPDVFEHRVTAYLESFFRDLGVRHERQPIAPLRDNIVAFYEPPAATWTLILEAHQDTVPTDHMTIEPFAATLAAGRLSGRGACDIKGGMAAMLGAFARLVRQRPPGCPRVLMACTVDEEHTFLGVQRLVRGDLRGGVSGPVLAVVAEPTCLDIVHAHKGAVRWTLHTTGRSCHSSRPELGVNAIYRMAGLLSLVERYAGELAASRADALLGPATLSVGRIEGGTSVNTVPDHCRAEVDRRVLPGETAQGVRQEFDAWLRKYAAEGSAFSCSDIWLNCPALSPQGSEELVARLGAAINMECGTHRVRPVPYGTDASTLAEAGIPSVVFGPGNIDQAHTCDEWVDVAEVETASTILYRLATAG
jgi:acetylornithine deacetylase